MHDDRPLGDAITLDALLSHRGFLISLARSLTRTDQDAEDLVQEAYVGALEGPGPRGIALRSWLAAIVRNTWRNIARRESERPWREGQADAPRTVATTSTDPGTVVRELDLRRLILDAVRGLPEPHRTTIYLRYYSGLSLAEIAKRTESPLETVRSRLKRGHEKLRERLDGEFGSRESWFGALVWIAETGGVAGTIPVAASALGPLLALLLAIVAGSSFLAWSLIGRSSSDAHDASVVRSSEETLGDATVKLTDASVVGTTRTPLDGPAALEEENFGFGSASVSQKNTGASNTKAVSTAPTAPRRVPGERGTAMRMRRNLWFADDLPAVSLEDLESQLAPRSMHTLHGRLTMHDGGSPEGWFVALRNPSYGKYGLAGHTSLEALGSRRSVVQTVDASGAFRFDGLFERGYDVIAWHPETLLHTVLENAAPKRPVFREIGPNGLVMDEGAPIELVVGDTRNARRIAGRLVSRSGAPVAGASVRAGIVTTDAGLRPDVLERWSLGPAALTDRDGRFELPHPTSFPVRLYFENAPILIHDDFVDLDAAQDADKLELVLPVRCRVTVELASKAPPGTHLVFLGTDERRMWIQVDATEAAAEDGVTFWRALELDHLPATLELYTSEDARHAVLFDKNGNALERRPLLLDPTRPTKLSW